MAKNNTAISKCLITIIRLYRYLISPLLGQHCRFYPSCSSYAIETLTSFGGVKGCFLIFKRILCCHPWHQGGYDPVPQREDKC